MKILKTILCLLGMIFLQNIRAQNASEEKLYRPNFHFTPEKGWMNDPNGMFYLNGTYHVFFQHYPEKSVWGPMHWGHATSKDLISWKHQPIALAPDNLGYIFSGSAVVDKNNTSGFGDGKNIPIVAIYTYHNMEKERKGDTDVESQGIAYSVDEGKTWAKYTLNPVLKNPGIRDFRDPKVMWYEKGQKWIMVLAAHDRIHFYESKNLKEWKFLSDFGVNLGAHGGVWECPDLFPLNVSSNNEQKWVLLVSSNPGGPNGGSATQYFVGDFNGKSFTIDPIFSKQIANGGSEWIDYGKDNYAGVTFSNTPNKILLGWMSNWEYAQSVPTTAWRSTLTIPRELSLVRESDKYFLRNLPIKNLEKYYGKSIKKNIQLKKQTNLIGAGQIDLQKAVIDLNLKNLSGSYIFYLSNTAGNAIKIEYSRDLNQLSIDRKNSGITNFDDKFSSKPAIMQLKSRAKKEISLKIILDKTSMEIFTEGGKSVMTEIFFPTAPFTSFSVNATAPNAWLKMTAFEIK